MARGGGVQEAQIQWYPGHMATAMRKLGERLRIVDVVVEVLDARLPRASSNPALDVAAAGKPRIVVLGREDLADPHVTREWLAWYAAQGRTALAVIGKDQASVRRVEHALRPLVSEAGATRVMVVGIPNTGKSSIINGLARRTDERTFSPSLTAHRTKYAWLGSDIALDAFTFIFRRNHHGLFQVHAYPYSGEMSTFIVETSDAVWRRAGLDRRPWLR